MDRVVGSDLGQVLAHELLHGTVGVTDRREVRLGVDHQVTGEKALQSQGIGASGEIHRESQVIGVRLSRGGRAHGGRP